MNEERRKFDMVALGGRMRALREARGLSQLDLDRAAGLARGMTNHYESGRREPELAVLVALVLWPALVLVPADWWR